MLLIIIYLTGILITYSVSHSNFCKYAVISIMPDYDPAKYTYKDQVEFLLLWPLSLFFLLLAIIIYISRKE